jgi:Ca2+/Na+ antiporter
MALFDEQEDRSQGENEDKKSNGSLFAVIGGIALLVSILVWNFADHDMARTVFFCLVAILVAIGICWDLRKHIWFWPVVVLIAALHMPVVLMVHWPHYWIPGIALVPIGFVDVLIMVGIIRFVQKFIVREGPPDEGE